MAQLLSFHENPNAEINRRGIDLDNSNPAHLEIRDASPNEGEKDTPFARPTPPPLTRRVLGLLVRPCIHEHPRHRLMPVGRSDIQRRHSTLRRAPASACTRPLRRPPPPSNGTSLL